MNPEAAPEQNEYRAYFTLVGDFQPDEITSELGILPSRSWAKGDLHPRTSNPRNHSRWSLDSRLSVTDYIDLHVLDVLDQLNPVAQGVLKLRSSYDGLIQMVAYFLNGQANISLDASIVEGVSKLRLGLDFDPYDLLANGEDS